MSIYDDYTPSGSSRTYRVLKRLTPTSIAALSRVIIDGIDAVIATLMPMPPGAADGQVLTADSAQSSGMKWADPAALGNLDGGDPSSVYGGTTNIDAGGVS